MDSDSDQQTDTPAPLLDTGQLSLAVEVIQDAIVVYDDHADIVIVNDKLLAATGYTRAELVGQPALTLLAADLRKELTPRMLAHAAAPTPREMVDGLTAMIARKDETTFEAMVATAPVLRPTGNLVVMTIRAVRDVSLEEIKLRGLLEANPDATVVCHPDGRMVLSNAGALRLFEREPISLFNQAVSSLFPIAHRPALEHKMRACHEAAVAGRAPQAHNLDTELIQLDDSVIPVEVTITSLRTVQGLTLRVIVRDISERLRQQREAEAAKDSFLATVSHELRTPLTSVLGYGELLEDLDAEDLSEHARSLLAVVIRNAQRELRLVDDLLTMVQIGEGAAFRIEPEQVNFHQLVLHSVEAAAPVAHRAGVLISVVTSDEDAYVLGDADRLGQAVDNLLTNSLKFSPAKGEVAVALSADAETVTVSVTNSGEGIRDGDVEHVFDRLYRGDNAVAAEKQGVGLGLSIVRSIVEAHGGDVGVACTPTTTCFQINLPRATRVRAPGPVRRPPGGPRRTAVPDAG